MNRDRERWDGVTPEGLRYRVVRLPTTAELLDAWWRRLGSERASSDHRTEHNVVKSEDEI